VNTRESEQTPSNNNKTNKLKGTNYPTKTQEQKYKNGNPFLYTKTTAKQTTKADQHQNIKKASSS
jgi:hypothetical protein